MDKIDFSMKDLTAGDNDDDEVLTKLQKHFFGKLPARFILVGKSGSGKTTILNNLLARPEMLGGIFLPQHCYLVSTTHRVSPSTKKLLKIPKDNVFSTIDTEALMKVFKQQEHAIINKNKKKVPHKVFIFDDILELNVNSPALQWLFTTGRHCKCSVFVLTQSIKGIPRTTRVNASHYICCNDTSYSDLERIYEDACSTLSKKDFIKYYEKASNSAPYQFLFVVKSAPEPIRYRVGLEKVIKPNPNRTDG